MPLIVVHISKRARCRAIILLSRYRHVSHFQSIVPPVAFRATFRCFVFGEIGFPRLASRTRDQTASRALACAKSRKYRMFTGKISVLLDRNETETAMASSSGHQSILQQWKDFDLSSLQVNQNDQFKFIPFDKKLDLF